MVLRLELVWFVRSLLSGEKSGHEIGNKLSIALKDAKVGQESNLAI
jgi:hypothetical protein